jgi:hypothetical protein
MSQLAELAQSARALSQDLERRVAVLEGTPSDLLSDLQELERLLVVDELERDRLRVELSRAQYRISVLVRSVEQLSSSAKQ